MGRQRNLTSKRQFGEEHCHLREIANQVEQALATLRGRPAEIATLLRALRQEVLEHFAHEETGGYFAEVIEVAPQLRRRAGELLLEHSQMAEQLAALAVCAAAEMENDTWWETMAELYGRFLALFAAHEAAENSLLQDAYCDDLAAED